MNAVDWRNPGVHLAAIAAAISVCGLLVSTLVFIYELGIDGVLILKVAFIGFMLYGIYGMPRGSGHNEQHFWLPVFFLVFWLMGMAVIYVAYGMFPRDPVLAADIAVGLPLNMSFLAGLGLTTVTLNLRPTQGSPNARVAVVSVFTLILVVLSWVIAEHATYGILSEDLEPMESYVIFQLSNFGFLATVFLVSLMGAVEARIERTMVGQRRSVDELQR